MTSWWLLLLRCLASRLRLVGFGAFVRFSVDTPSPNGWRTSGSICLLIGERALRVTKSGRRGASTTRLIADQCSQCQSSLISAPPIRYTERCARHRAISITLEARSVYLFGARGGPLFTLTLWGINNSSTGTRAHLYSCFDYRQNRYSSDELTAATASCLGADRSDPLELANRLVSQTLES